MCLPSVRLKNATHRTCSLSLPARPEADNSLSKSFEDLPASRGGIGNELRGGHLLAARETVPRRIWTKNGRYPRVEVVLAATGSMPPLRVSHGVGVLSGEVRRHWFGLLRYRGFHSNSQGAPNCVHGPTKSSDKMHNGRRRLHSAHSRRSSQLTTEVRPSAGQPRHHSPQWNSESFCDFVVPEFSNIS
jgi:hypothetical protein